VRPAPSRRSLLYAQPTDVDNLTGDLVAGNQRQLGKGELTLGSAPHRLMLGRFWHLVPGESVVLTGAASAT